MGPGRGGHMFGGDASGSDSLLRVIGETVAAP